MSERLVKRLMVLEDRVLSLEMDRAKTALAAVDARSQETLADLRAKTEGIKRETMLLKSLEAESLNPQRDK